MWSTPEARLAATKKRTLPGESWSVEAVNSMAITLAIEPCRVCPTASCSRTGRLC